MNTKKSSYGMVKKLEPEIKAMESAEKTYEEIAKLLGFKKQFVERVFEVST